MKSDVKATRRSQTSRRSFLQAAKEVIEKEGLEEAAQKGVQEAVRLACKQNQRTAQAYAWLQRREKNKREAQALLKAITAARKA